MFKTYIYSQKLQFFFVDILPIFIKLLPNAYLHENYDNNNFTVANTYLLILGIELANMVLKKLHKKRTNEELCTFRKC